MTKDFRKHFEDITNNTFSELLPGETMSICYYSESSHFCRFNNCKVRQNGDVEQISVSVKLWKDSKQFSFCIELSGNIESDTDYISNSLSQARLQLELLPDDPYFVLPESTEKSESIFSGKLLNISEIPEKILEPAKNLDFTGLYTQGLICRASANSIGANHWFQTETFLMDFSAWLPNGRAVKSSYSGNLWSDSEYSEIINNVRQSIKTLEKEMIVLQPGKYRAYIAPAALNEVMEFFSWHGFGEQYIRENDSAYIALKECRKKMSEKFTLTQDFSLGIEPRFNDDGELSPEKLTIVKNGLLENTLISSRTAKQYDLKSNGADEEEEMSSISIEAGNMESEEILTKLGTGIYVSNFHYLNWSDVPSARITGMTRFSCMWVEDGKIVGPIKDMRWDDSLYNILGENLIEVSKDRQLIVNNASYGQRYTGGALIPGILVKSLNCTL